MNSPVLYIVATPIGNLNDMSFRAIETLKAVDCILAEDTRVTKKLLDHYQINKPLLSYHHHSDGRKIKEILDMVLAGKTLAQVSDAGTPGISDPGNELIHQLVARMPELMIVPIPGASAVVAALSVSGFPTDSFLFLGFPPHKNKRQKFFKEVADSQNTVVFYESGHRIKKCLGELAAIVPSKPLVVCRELTKQFETVYRGQAKDVLEKIDERGEFVVVVDTR